jgi:hypothetical protein
MSQLNSLSDYLPLLNQQMVDQDFSPKHLFKTSNCLYYKVYKNAVKARVGGEDHV